MKYFTVALIIFLSVSDLFAQEKVVINGYYLTLEGDTVYGNLLNKRNMILKFRSPEGKKRQFMPSKIKAFRIDETDYKSIFLPDLKTYRYLQVLEKGSVTLLIGNDSEIERLNPPPSGGLYLGVAVNGIGVAVPVSNKKNEPVYSGMYIEKEGDTTVFSVPAKNDVLYLFLQEHFSDNDTLVQAFIDHPSGINDLRRFVYKYNSLKKP
jgi:hypothetical protein